MARSGRRVLRKLDDDYLPPEDRKARSKYKQKQLRDRALTPDWFDRDRYTLPRGFRVAVIGGGFAGLVAAWYLRECGAQTVTVFEAAGRTGGRVQTDRTFVPGKIVEAGAELIGENHPLWWILAGPRSLPLHELTDDDAYESGGFKCRLVLGGVQLTDAQKEQLGKDLLPHLKTIGKEAASISETEPWTGSDAPKWDAQSVSGRLDKLIGKQSSFVRLWFEFTLGNDNCARIEDQSYLGLLASVSAARMGDDERGLLGYWMSTETHRCQGGNERLADALRASLDVRLSTPAKRVEIHRHWNRPVRVIFSGQDVFGQRVELGYEDYHYAILTAPPTVWKDIQFDPPFNPASRTIQHGPAVKYLFRYATRFWEPAKLAPVVKSDQLGSLWEGTDGQLPSPDYGLSVFSGGPYVLSASEYPKRVGSLYPTGTALAEQFVDWPSARFIKTGYGVPAVGQVTTVSRTQILPHEEFLYFAGEQTSSGFFGYMEGALQSGARAARDIVRRARQRVTPQRWFDVPKY